MDDPVSMEELDLKQKLLQRRVLTTLEGLEKEKSPEEVLSRFKREIEEWVEELEAISFGMEEIYAKEGDAETLSSLSAASFRFKYDVRKRLSLLRKTEQGETPAVTSSDGGIDSIPSQENSVTPDNKRSSPSKSAAQSSFMVEPFKIKLKGPHFNEEDFKKDKRSFKDFLVKFENCARSITSDTEKLYFLRCSLEGRALQLIDHLSPSEESYLMALKLLKEQYVDEEEIRGEIIQGILDFQLDNPRNLEELRNFIVKTQADMWELRASYNCDLYDDRSAGAIIISQVLFAKIPPAIKVELLRISGSYYPSLSVLLKETPRIIKRVLVARTAAKIMTVKPRPQPKFKTPTESSSLETFNTNLITETKCEFCKSSEHLSDNCNNYTTHEARISRCRELRLCFRCIKKSHLGNMCPLKTSRKVCCLRCKSKGHVTAMCSSVTSNMHIDTCLRTKDCNNSFLSPIIGIMVKKGDKEVKVNCLLDTGSQRTYLDYSILKKLNCLSLAKDRTIDVKTFLGTSPKMFKEILLNLNLFTGKTHTLPILATKLNLSYNLESLPQMLRNLKNRRLAAHFYGKKTLLTIDGLLGIDAIQYLEPLKVIPCMYGAAFETQKGLIPFGNVNSFLFERQIKKRKETKVNYAEVLARTPQLKTSRINYVIHPEECYPDPLNNWFKDSNVERGLENMFNLESIGLPTDEKFSTLDEEKVKQFKDSITFKDGLYHVRLQWYEDKLKSVPSNYNASLRILDKVTKDLEKKKLYDQYLQVFQQQEDEGIIEEIIVPPKNFKDYTWIPHRPVLKLTDQTTTKIRPVFNCSYKQKGSVSLNEAAYPGVNLMTDMLELTIRFRTNKYVLLADIRKAFLMIRLESEKDRNRFCFFLKKGENLHCYRYKTIIFGFNASPFILNYVLKFHADKFPLDACSEALKSNFYVDNLVKTGNNPETLSALYTSARERLHEGNFDLQSCNSNCVALKKKMEADGTLSAYEPGYEKVLGYLYDPEQDSIRVPPPSCDVEASTKRKILSETSKVFDPLSLYLPVTVRGRLLIRELWKLKLNWDDPVPQSMCSVWKTLANDLAAIDSVSFPRRVLDEGKDTKLFLFCDAAKSAYGFTVYAVQDGKSSLVFAKAKMAPLQGRSLPTLELLSVFLAMKCFPFIKQSLKDITVKNIYVITDAQVVLSWVLADFVQTKNIFVRHRLQDINQMTEKIKTDLDIKVNFRYVPTANNPADFLTRGLTINRFKENLPLWYEGPEWIRQEESSWHHDQLGCLSKAQMGRICPSVNYATENEVATSVVELERFSSLSKLISVTSLIFEFVNRLKKRVMDPKLQANTYLIKTMQKQSFSAELNFLLNPEENNVPKLVKDLNLFMDPKGIVRSRGRIEKSVYHPYEVQNPVLLGKKHRLTELIIRECHQRSQHLGLATTLNQVRLAGYWIPQARQAIKNVVGTCAKCKRFNAVSFSTPNPTNLPTPRVNFSKPFLHTGVDFTSHIYVKGKDGDYKMYIVLFTCMSIRAVHLELVPDMSVKSFIQAFVRFTNVNGIPTHLYSDNARTFTAAARIINKGMITDEFKERFNSYDLKHCTIPLFSPWYGGSWERSIKTIKSCLYKAIGRGKVDYFGLLTILSDVQRAVNSRPLTYISSDDSELDILTPNSLMNANVGCGILMRFEDQDLETMDPLARRDLIQTLRSREDSLQKFRKLWNEDYLLSLRERTLNLADSSFEDKIKPGDIVLIKSPLKTRPFWSLGKVLELIRGSDNLVRMVKVKKGNGAIDMHSIKHLFPLEFSQQPEEPDPTDMEPSSSQDVSLDPQRRESTIIWICPACNRPEDTRPMIACDTCDDWFHFDCVGLIEAPPEDEQWCCNNCNHRDLTKGRPSLSRV